MKAGKYKLDTKLWDKIVLEKQIIGKSNDVPRTPVYGHFRNLIYLLEKSNIILKHLLISLKLWENVQI